MAGEVEQMAYRLENGVPWHGLGNQIPADATLDECIELGGLNSQVVSVKLYYRDPSSLDERGVGRVIEAQDYRAIIRDTDGRVFQVAGADYTPVQNREMVQTMREAIESLGLKLDTLGSLRQGAIVWAQATLPDGFKVGNGDKVRGRILAYNSHDGTLSFGFKLSAERTVCMNTLELTLHSRGQHWKAKHTKRVAQRIEEGRKLMGLMRDTFYAYQQEALELAESGMRVGGQAMYEYVLRLTQPELLSQIVEAQQAEWDSTVKGSLLDAVVAQTVAMPKRLTEMDLNRVGRAIVQEILDSPGAQEAGQTWWRAENGVTRWADHVAGRSQDTRLQSAWFGANAGLKQGAHQIALQYARAGRS